MLNRKSSLLLLSFIVILIVFDAFQQKYYIDTFSLAGSDPISLKGLLVSHFLRWFIWAVGALSFGIIVWKKVLKKGRLLDLKAGAFIIISLISIFYISILLITLTSMFRQGSSFTYEAFFEIQEFFVYQKGLTFFMAYCALILLLINQSRSKVIDEQWIEIENLSQTSNNLSKALESVQDNKTPHINIKTGYKIKPIPLNEVMWIESDDYCAKIHTQKQIFTIRKSLKSFEEQLAPFGFIRVHRKTLLNLDFLDQINFDDATIRLVDTSELNISKSGLQRLKETLQAKAL